MQQIDRRSAATVQGIHLSSGSFIKATAKNWVIQNVLKSSLVRWTAKIPMHRTPSWAEYRTEVLRKRTDERGVNILNTITLYHRSVIQNEKAQTKFFFIEIVCRET